MPADPATGAPITPAGTINGWTRYGTVDERATYALNTDETAYETIVAETGENSVYYVDDLDAYPPNTNEIADVTTAADGGDGSLRAALADADVKIIKFGTGGYFDVDTALIPPSGKIIVGDSAPTPVAFRCSTSSTGRVFEIGQLNTVVERVALRHITIMGGVGNGAQAKRDNILLRNGFCFLDHVTSVLSNNQALTVTNNAEGQAVISLSNPNFVALNCVLGLTLYETGGGGSNTENPHPMNINMQELGVGIIRKSLLFAGDNRNPLVTEGGTLLLIDSYIYACGEMPAMRGVDGVLTRLELAGVYIRQGKVTSSSATLTNNQTESVYYPVEAYLDYTRRLKNNSVDNGNDETAGDEITLLETPAVAPTLILTNVPASVLSSAGARLPAVPQILQLIVHKAQNQLGDSREATSVGAVIAADGNPLNIAIDARGYPTTV